MGGLSTKRTLTHPTPRQDLVPITPPGSTDCHLPLAVTDLHPRLDARMGPMVDPQGESFLTENSWQGIPRRRPT